MSECKLRIVLEKPPAGVDFGIQKGRGTSYETICKQRSNGGDVAMEFSVEFVESRQDYRGPLVQGPPGERFVYVDIGTYAGQTGACWGRRLKVPLRGIADCGSSWEARVPGTAKDGGPACGTVKPFAGWMRR